MWWLHEVEIHLVIGSMAAGAAIGTALTLLIIHFNKGDK